MSVPEKVEALQTPDEIVEERILARLATAFPTDAETLAKLKGQLASGIIKIDDWKLHFELLLGKPNKIACGEKS